MKQRFMEILGLMMIGDGVASLMAPRRHSLLWKTGPKPWKKTIDAFANHPAMTRGFGIVETMCGMWLASKQLPARGWSRRLTR